MVCNIPGSELSVHESKLRISGNILHISVNIKSGITVSAAVRQCLCVRTVLFRFLAAFSLRENAYCGER